MHRTPESYQQLEQVEPQWTEREIRRVWRRGRTVPGYDSEIFRRDVCGAWIKFSEYGKEEGCEHGWRIDGSGSTSIDTLRPLHWINYRQVYRGDIRDCGDCLIVEY